MVITKRHLEFLDPLKPLELLNLVRYLNSKLHEEIIYISHDFPVT
jgi:ABC-type proline/glycine betaine transport system ATPase subunit